MDEQPTSPSSTDEPQPVAYDSKGQPLYAGPPIPNHSPQTAPQFVHLSRAVSPVEPDISPEIKARHEQSLQDYPFLNLSDAEFVISAVRRHPIGLVAPVALTIFLVALVASITINFPLIVSYFSVGTTFNYPAVLLCGALLSFLVLVGGYTAIWVYTNNKFFLTNESVIQEIQTGLFSRREQTVSLVNIEDASFHQEGIMQSMFDYGSLRLSTEGDETTYRFNYVSNPKQQIAILNNAVEAFKNGRPVIND